MGRETGGKERERMEGDIKGGGYLSNWEL